MPTAWTWLLRAGLLLTGSLPWLWWALPDSAQHGALQSFSSFCHQRAERSLLWMEQLMPVCSRCGGLFAGLLLGALILPPAVMVAHWKRWILAATALMFLEIGVQDFLRHSPYHPTRLLTGLALGWILAGGAIHLLTRSDRVA